MVAPRIKISTTLLTALLLCGTAVADTSHQHPVTHAKHAGHTLGDGAGLKIVQCEKRTEVRIGWLRVHADAAYRFRSPHKKARVSVNGQLLTPEQAVWLTAANQAYVRIETKGKHKKPLQVNVHGLWQDVQTVDLFPASLQARPPCPAP